MFTTSDVRLIFILSPTMDEYLEVRIQARDKQYSSCPLIQETKIMKILNKLTSLYHVEQDIDLAIKKGLTFYQTRSNANILQGTLPAYCISKVLRMKTGEVWYEESIYVT